MSTTERGSLPAETLRAIAKEFSNPPLAMIKPGKYRTRGGHTAEVTRTRPGFGFVVCGVLQHPTATVRGWLWRADGSYASDRKASLFDLIERL